MKAGHTAHLSFNIANLLFLLIYLLCKMILELRKLEVNFNYLSESIIKLNINVA